MSALPDPLSFGNEWARAWNRRDLEGVLANFHTDARFTSPVAVQIGLAIDGVVKGKEALRNYWTTALGRNPDLHFQVTATFVGVDTIVIAYRTQKDEDKVEVLTFREGLIVEGHGLFGSRSERGRDAGDAVRPKGEVVRGSL